MADTRALKRILKNIEYVNSKVNEYSENTPMSDIKMCLALLKDEWKDFSDVETSNNGRFTDPQLEIVNKIESAYLAVKQELYHFEQNCESDTQGNTTIDDLMANQSRFVHELTSLNKRDTEVRLPRMNIPTFSGIYSEFPSFKDLFEASIDKDPKMSNVHKMQYLKCLLKGEAYALIKHLSVTEVNYTQAWQKVKARYDKPKHVVYNLLKQFMDQPVLRQSTAKGLRHLTDVSDEIIRGLQVLGAEAEKRDLWLIYLLMEKLDVESKEAWAHDPANNNFPSLEAFFKFLNKRCDALECISSSQNSKGISSKRVSTMVAQAAIVGTCTMCDGEHYIGKCSKFLELAINERREVAANKKLCFNCLSTAHQAKMCRSKYTCRLCKRKHHVALHTDLKRDDDSEPGTSISNKGESETKVLTVTASESEKGIANVFQAILPTVIVLVKDEFGELQKCRALLDSGSQSSFVSENCAQRLRLKRERASVNVTGITSGSLTVRGRSTVLLHSMYDEHIKVSLEVLIINQLPTEIPKTKIRISNKNFAREFELADPYFDSPAPIDLLIGADKFFEILERKQKRYNSLILNKTIFGWVVTGQPRSINEENTKAFTTFTQQSENLESTMRKFWEMEEVSNAGNLAPEEMECENFFVRTHERSDEGRYVVRLPFKRDCGKLGESLPTAIARFRSLERKLIANPTLRAEYVKQMREYINLGHMVEIRRNYPERDTYYLPHHPVIKESSDTTKIRVVFDESSKSDNGSSLNDKLMVGRTIQPTLWAILLRFRTNKVALVADIEKMYLQVIVAAEHRSFQTILWREQPDEVLRHYQLTRVTFGLACSAFLAIRAMQQLAIDSKNDELKAHVFQNFYVDDILTGSEDEKGAVELKNKLTNELAKGGFCLRKWRSNLISLSDASNQVPASDIYDDITSVVKTLGLQWHPIEDSFTYKINPEVNDVISKRKIISESSRVFDPLGFLSPSTIILKMLFQKLWLLKVGWDDKLPRELEEEYRRVRKQFIHFEYIKIPRYTNHQGEIQIHGFSDASETAYCAAIYSRNVKEDGSITTQLLTAKTKVAPIKKLSLPRLELCAAHLLVKLMSAVKQNFQTNARYYAWTDSTIVLAWLSTYPMRWKTFVANRTSLILDSFPRHHWSHVKSKDNPADHGSRGVAPDKIVNLAQWWSGPEWLAGPETSWPMNEGNHNTNRSDVDMEYSKTTLALPTVTMQAEGEQGNNSWLEELMENKFRLNKIFRVVAYVLRFINAIKGPKKKTASQLSATEINYARIKCVIWVQHAEFKGDIQSIRRYKKVSNKSKLLMLAPFIDEDGVMRVGGRMQNAYCDFDSKHPIILPQKHIFTTRVIWDIHLSKLHAGASLTSNFIRQNYWVINGRSRIRSVLKGCVTCARYAAKTTKQLMGNLPAVRVTPTRPFENCGIDFAGPIYTTARKGRGRAILNKGYICIFVCLSVKAIHIEAVTDLTSEAFLAALKRFSARRGIPRRIYTDNGSNFVGARRILDQACKLIRGIQNNYTILEFLSRSGIEWHFIPPMSPHFGGLWEAAVKSTKSHLNKATRNVNLTFEEISTLLCQIENILNSRPLYTSSTDDDYEVLTPAHFLIGTSTSSIPETDINLPENRLSRWQIIQSRVQSFWKRYYLEYLNNIQQRHKWHDVRENIKFGDVVLIKEDNTSASKWPLGRITQVHPGTDGIVRAVTLKTSSSTLQRPVVKLCKLPVG